MGSPIVYLIGKTRSEEYPPIFMNSLCNEIISTLSIANAGLHNKLLGNSPFTRLGNDTICLRLHIVESGFPRQSLTRMLTSPWYPPIMDINIHMPCMSGERSITLCVSGVGSGG